MLEVSSRFQYRARCIRAIPCHPCLDNGNLMQKAGTKGVERRGMHGEISTVKLLERAASFVWARMERPPPTLVRLCVACSILNRQLDLSQLDSNEAPPKSTGLHKTHSLVNLQDPSSISKIVRVCGHSAQHFTVFTHCPGFICRIP